MSDALRLTGVKTKREAVELGLRTLLRLRQQEEIHRFPGTITPQTERLDALLGSELLVVGDLILAEVLQAWFIKKPNLGCVS